MLARGLRFGLIVLFVGILCNTGRAQEEKGDSLIKVLGQVLMTDSITPIGNVHIVNRQLGKGTTTANHGFFSLASHLGDTLEFSAVGFVNSIFKVSETYRPGSYSIKILLVKDTVNLKPFTVIGVREWEEFKNEFINMGVEEDSVILSLTPQPNMSLPQSGGFGVSVVGPFTYLYNRFSKKGRTYHKIAKFRAIRDRKGMEVEKKEK